MALSILNVSRLFQLLSVLAAIASSLFCSESGAQINGDAEKQLFPVYRSACIGAVLTIDYDMPYLTALASDNLIATAEPFYETKDMVINLDFKLSNASDRIKYATSFSFKNIQSEKADYAIPYILPDRYRSVDGGNLGWAILQDLKVLYAVERETNGRCIARPISDNGLISVQPVVSNTNRGELFSWNIDYANIPRYFNATRSGDGADVWGCVSGRIDYLVHEKKYQQYFSVKTQLNGSAALPAMIVDSQYDLNLPAGKSGYSYDLPVSNYMMRDCVERIVVRFSSDQSAKFKFDVSINFTDQGPLDLGSVVMNYFRPKGLIGGVYGTQLTDVRELPPQQRDQVGARCR
ncbi:MAG: hypothetical protein WB764_27815 [Xanthobacteraceae bacterium]